MRVVTKKWLFLKISSAILIPLMIWFIINFASFYDKNYNEIVSFLSTQPSKFFFSSFLIFSYFFYEINLFLPTAQQEQLWLVMMSQILFKFTVMTMLKVKSVSI